MLIYLYYYLLLIYRADIYKSLSGHIFRATLIENGASLVSLWWFVLTFKIDSWFVKQEKVLSQKNLNKKYDLTLRRSRISLMSASSVTSSCMYYFMVSLKTLCLILTRSTGSILTFGIMLVVRPCDASVCGKGAGSGLDCWGGDL